MNHSDRKIQEAEFHDKVRDKKLAEEGGEEFERLTSNRKFYSIAVASENFKNDFIKNNCRGKRTLDYCCGDGPVTLFTAENGADAFGIDISPASIENCRKEAEKRGLSDKAHFMIMDAEKMDFEDSFFDLITVFGVLHHLDVKKAYPELSRVLKPDGKIICSEPLVYNPVFQLYRRLTPQLRTEWETDHILKKQDIELSKKYFNQLDKRFFYLFMLLAVPFRNYFFFNSLLPVLEKIDEATLRIPGIKWLAWQCVFILSGPIKEQKQASNTIEERKIKEIEYYDKEAQESGSEKREAGSKGGFNPLSLASYAFLYSLVEKKFQGKKVLDYGCGSGIHIPHLAKNSKEVVGIDLSSKSLDMAKRKAEKEDIRNVEFVLRDCENTGLEDNSFDAVFDGGTFSSLDFDKAIKEIIRVLKPGGMVIGIETLGHNPITNLKRKLNKIRGTRTGWAAEHIFKMEDLKKAESYFESVDAEFFHLISWLAFPVMNLPGGRFLLKLFQALDRIFLLLAPFLKRYCFKIVFVFSKPKNK